MHKTYSYHMFSAAEELLCCDVTMNRFSFSLVYVLRSRIQTFTCSGLKGEPTHIHEHNDAHKVMQDSSGFADSLMTTGMSVQALCVYARMHTHAHTHTLTGLKVYGM